jgi:hypothetical protein
MITNDSFLEILSSTGRSTEISAEDDLYGWLIGSWDLDLKLHDDAGVVHDSRGEAHFSWVLEGRAIQDIFINPRRSERGPALAKLESNWFGSTLRMYDPSHRNWRITWLNPITGSSADLIGRRSGEDIVQQGKFSDGGVIRWTFHDIATDSFRWLGERWDGDAEMWRTQVEFRGWRVS